MHNPCCPVLLEAVCARSPLKQFKEILLLAVAACELPAATMLTVQLILHSFAIPQIIPSGACHSPGLQLARRRPFFSSRSQNFAARRLRPIPRARP